MKATEQFFPVLKLVMLYKEFQTSVWVKPLGETVSKKAAKHFRPCAFQFGVLFEILKSSNENSKGLPPSPNKICVRRLCFWKYQGLNSVTFFHSLVVFHLFSSQIFCIAIVLSVLFQKRPPLSRGVLKISLLFCLHSLKLWYQIMFLLFLWRSRPELRPKTIDHPVAILTWLWTATLLCDFFGFFLKDKIHSWSQTACSNWF